MSESTKSHSIDWRAELEDAISLLEYRGDEPFIRGQVISRLQDAQVAIYEQLQALQTAAQRILEAPKGTSHSQFRFWLMDALGDATPASTSEAREDGEDA